MEEKELRLLTEWMPLRYTKETIAESKKLHGGKVMLTGILQRANTLNQNGRVYPKEILEREIENYQKLIRESRALGECDHPDTSVVELKNCSHIVRKAYMDGDDVYGTIELLETPNGKILQALVEAGVTTGISSRGVGSVREEKGQQIVQEDFQLICFDMVSEPSTPGAFMMAEGKKVTQRDLRELFNNSDRVDRIFNDILSWENE